jgi:uncharacterized protein YdeI (YjbR/CyaY-like superfamily)
MGWAYFPGMSAPRFFRTPADFRAWLHANHHRATELLVGFHKKGSGTPSLTWPESVDEALCYGWIDGVRRSLGQDSYTIRFTPRKAVSIWSNVNVAKVEALLKAGRMLPAGLAAWARRDPAKTGVYAFERLEAASFDEAAVTRFRRDRAAWRYFQAQPPGYRRLATHWVVSAKRSDTRERRLAALIDHSARGERLPRTLNPAKPNVTRVPPPARRSRAASPAAPVTAAPAAPDRARPRAPRRAPGSPPARSPRARA